MIAPDPGLGAADVSPEQLTRIVATYFEVPEQQVEVLTRKVDPVAYDLPAITTASRHWVSGEANTPRGRKHFQMFVKVVQAWSRHPFFEFVPEDEREFAAAGVPWRTEALVYRSDLRDRLPDGLTMPRALHVADLDEESASIWLEEVQVRDVRWDLARYARAARLLGRLAASPAVAPLAGVGEFDWSVLTYVHGRLMMGVVPSLRDPETWRHPLMAGFADLRMRLLDAADRAPGYGEELAALPLLTGHGDACPGNLLAGPDGDIVLIDFGFWHELPVGYDLGQLLVGEVQLGHEPASSLAATERAVVAAYLEGLRAEGCDIPEETVLRAHALHLLLFTGLSSFPVEHFEEPVTPQLEGLAADRAKLARFSLDLLDATG